MKSLERLFTQHQKFSEKTFTKSTWKSSLNGCIREIKECRKEGNRLSKTPDLDQSTFELELEYVDCFMYLLDSMNRVGISIEDFKHAFNEKLEINKNRVWKKNKDNSYSHIE